MVFYYFGPSSSSWAVGNSVFSTSRNLPPEIATVWNQIGQPFQDKSMAGTQIEYMATSPDGSYCIVLRNGDLLSNRNDLLESINAHRQSDFFSRVEHVSFSPYGAFFVSYSNGTVHLSAEGRFPDSFYALVSPYVQLTGPQRSGLQVSRLKYVFFGADDSVLVKTTTEMLWSGVSESLVAALKSFTFGNLLSAGYELGKHTALCPWNKEFFFLEASSFLGQAQYPYNLPADSGLSNDAMLKIIADQQPPPHLLRVAAPHPSPPPPPMPPAATASAPPRPPRPPPAPVSSAHNARPHSVPATTQAASTPPPPPPLPPRTSKPSPVSPPPTTTTTPTRAEPPSASERQLDAWANTLQMPEEMRALFDSLFDECLAAAASESGSGTRRSYLTGIEAAQVFSGTGLHNDDLAMIWDKTDLDRNGRFDRDEFIQAMWLISIQHQLANGGGSAFDAGDWGAGAGGNYYGYNNGSSGVPSMTAMLKKFIFGDGDGDGNNANGANNNIGGSSSSTNTGGGGGDGGGGESTNDSIVEKTTKSFQDKQLREALLSSIVSEKPNVRWDDVAGLAPAKDELQEAIIFPLRFPHMFQGKRKPRRAILLYGPPGTGKSYLAKAVATEVDHTLFSISASDVTSKWIGESEGLVRQLFKLAREKKPSIIFIDEIDALCADRSSSSSGGGGSNEDTSRMKTEFLVQLDGLGSDNDGVLLLAATNLPWALDPAVRRRFQKRIHIPLPDEAARAQLFRIHAGPELAGNLREEDFAELARRSGGYSGSDVANAVQDALMIPIKKVHSARYFRRVGARGEFWTPCDDAREHGTVAMTWRDVPANRLREPALAVQDFFDALAKVKPSVGPEEVRRCHEWTEQYGLEGA